jgi:hypothetical protein
VEVSGHLHAPAALPQIKNPRYPLDRRLGGPQNRSELGVEEKNSQPPLGIESRLSDRPAHSQSLLYRLSYPGSFAWQYVFEKYVTSVKVLLEQRRDCSKYCVARNVAAKILCSNMLERLVRLLLVQVIW